MHPLPKIIFSNDSLTWLICVGWCCDLLPGSARKQQKCHGAGISLIQVQRDLAVSSTYVMKTTPSRTESRKPLLLNKGNPPWIGMCAWTYHQFTILSWKFKTFQLWNLSSGHLTTLNEVWVIQIKYLFRFLIFLLYSTRKYGKVFLIFLLAMPW